jgi:hypothetical protein
LWEVLDAPESGIFEAADAAANVCWRRSVRADSAPTLTKGAVTRDDASAHAARSNIQAGTSSPRSAADPLSVQRKMTLSAFATASWIATRVPNHGCHW